MNNQLMADRWRLVALMVVFAMGVVVTQPVVAQAPPSPAPVEPDAAVDPDAPEEPERFSLSFSNMKIPQIAQFLNEKTGKPVIPHSSIKSKSINIVNSSKVTFEEAMLLIREALRQEGIIIEEYPAMWNLKPITEVRRSMLRVVGPEESAASIDDKALIVDKIFEVKHYDVMQLKDAVVPMLSDYAHITSDPNTQTLVVTDSVGNLEHIEKIISRLDLPMANQTIKKIIEIEKGDAAEIVSLLRILIGAGMGRDGKPISISSGQINAGGGGQSSRPSYSSRDPRYRGPSRPSSGGSSSSSVKQIDADVYLEAEVAHNWIIAVASAELMSQIEEWVVELDKPSISSESYEIVEVKYLDVEDVVEQITQFIQAVPYENLHQSTRVVPFDQSNKMAIFGSERGRDYVKELLSKLDTEDVNKLKLTVIHLVHADAEVVAENIEALFTDSYVSYKSSYSTNYSTRRGDDANNVSATADTINNSVIVRADEEQMEAIEKMIKEEWDIPIDTAAVEPKVYEIIHADPLQLQELLQSLFSDSSSDNSLSNYFFGRYGQDDSSSAAVGPLYGQFSFETMSDSNRIVVTTKKISNFVVIDRLIEQLDQPQVAGLPRTIELKHAKAEDLAEQVNAALAESGTLAEILRSDRTRLVSPEANTSGGGNNAPQDNRNGGNNQGGQANANTMRFWWQQSRQQTTERESSNLIGKVRVVPIVRRNALLILAPAGYIEPISELIAELDQPGLQVIIHAIITEVEHADESSIGMRFASDPSLFSDPRLFDQSAGGSVNVTGTEILGDTFTVGSDEFARGLLNTNLDLNILIQLLQRNFGLRILFEPKMFTSDNQEAEFFDGQDIPYQTSNQTSQEGRSSVQQFNYRDVGTTLRVRPHITKEGDVDLTINLVLSNVAQGESVSGNPTFNRRETSTNVIVHNGQTVMLSGIIQQDTFDDVRKIPFLGDLPLVGGLFTNTVKNRGNRELVAFITPYVVTNNPEEVDQLMKPYQEKLKRFRNEIDAPIEAEAMFDKEPAEDAKDGKGAGEAPDEKSKGRSKKGKKGKGGEGDES